MAEDKTQGGRMRGLVLETSSRCQLKCPLCFLRSFSERPEEDLMGLDVAGALSPYLSGLSSIDLTGWGEPFLNPELFRIIELLNKSFHGKMTITTNGLLLEPPSIQKIIDHGLDTVCVSMDAAYEQTYNAARPPGSFMHLRRVLDELASARARAGAERPLLFAAFLLRKDALAEVPDFVSMVAAHGFDGVVFQQLTGVFSGRGLSQVTHHEYYESGFDRSLLDHAMVLVKEHSPGGFIVVEPERFYPERVGGCGGFDLSMPFITPSGDVSVCCAMAYPCSLMRRDGGLEKTRPVTFGNVLETPLPQIWEGPEYARTREEILSGALPRACGDCIALYMKPGRVWRAGEE